MNSKKSFNKQYIVIAEFIMIMMMIMMVMVTMTVMTTTITTTITLQQQNNNNKCLVNDEQQSECATELPNASCSGLPCATT